MNGISTKLAILLPLASVFAFVACGDDTTGTTSGTSDNTTSSSSSSSTGSSSSSGSGSSSSSGGAGGGAPMGACTNAADLALAQDPTVPTLKDKVTDCGKMSLGQEPATKDCITKLGLTPACTDCFDLNVQCVGKNCLLDCAADPASQKCTDCRAMFCDKDFVMCSGLPAN